MKITNGIFLLAVLLFIAACVPVTLNPIYEKNDLVAFNDIVGTWGEDSSETYIFSSCTDDSLSYILDYIVDSSEYLNFCSSRFILRFSKIGKHYYADCYPDFEDNNEFKNWPLTAHLLGVHSFYRMKLSNDTLLFWRMEGEKLESWLSKRTGVTQYQFFKDQRKLLLTGSTPEIRNFLANYECDLDSLFTDMIELVRIK
jgi:hypothetical protein